MLFIHGFIYFSVLFKTRIYPIRDGTKLLSRRKKKARQRITAHTKLRQTKVACCSLIWGERNNSKLLLRAMHRSSRGRVKDFRYVAGNSIMLTNSAWKGALVGAGRGAGCGAGGLCWEPRGAEHLPHGAPRTRSSAALPSAEPFPRRLDLRCSSNIFEGDVLIIRRWGPDGTRLTRPR